jgi:23S rRNA (cytidine2498-2'-O)-methyltransferase
MANTTENLLILSADPVYADAAWQELRAISPAARRHATLAPGVVSARTAEPFAQIGRQWQAQRPVFVRHIAPAELLVELTGGSADLPALVRAVRQGLADAIPTSTTFSVQSRIFAPVTALKPFDINTTLSDLIIRETGATLDVRAPQHILSVAIGPVKGMLTACLGVSPTAWNLSDWAGGERRFRREDGQISRAEFKLLEALEQFNLTLPERGVALDLGAAPGGWSRVVRQRRPELRVTAIDPGLLHPSLEADFGIHHVRTSAENYLRSLTPRHRFDLILNDMRMDARRSAEMMVAYAPFLEQEGCGIMTAKLPEHDPLPVLAETRAILQQAFVVIGARHLFHNRSEVTLAVRRQP